MKKDFNEILDRRGESEKYPSCRRRERGAEA